MSPEITPITNDAICSKNFPLSHRAVSPEITPITNDAIYRQTKH